MNTILANNLESGSANDCTLISGAIKSNGYNLIQVPGSCVFAGPGDITGLNPLLGRLASNGGDTFTHALINGSIAIDYIPNGTNGCGTTITSDQRGAVRPQGTGCEIGAYEGRGIFNINLPLILKN